MPFSDGTGWRVPNRMVSSPEPTQAANPSLATRATRLEVQSGQLALESSTLSLLHKANCPDTPEVGGSNETLAR